MTLPVLDFLVASVGDVHRRIYARPTAADAARRGVPASWREHYSKQAKEADSRGAAIRWFGAILTTCLTAHWLGLNAALIWVLTVAFFEWGVIPVFVSKLISANVVARPKRAQLALAVLSMIGAAVYVLPWSLSWAAAGPEFGFFAGLSLGLTLMHAAVYLNRSAASFWIGVGPALVATAIVATAANALNAPLWVTAIALSHAVFYTLINSQDSRALKQLVVEQRTEVRSAQQAAQAKSDFLATMSHELRTPLSAVIGYAEILEEELAEIDQRALAGDAARIRRAARNLLVLINEVLDFSKIDAGRMELSPVETNVRDVLSEVMETVGHLAAANGNRLSLDFGADVPLLVLDGNRLRQCVLNLVSNACKFTENGDIRVIVRCTSGVEDCTLSVAVADTGCGISEEDRARLFKPFVQVDGSLTRKQGGTGLGLVITQRLANMMGGDVVLESEVGKGSTFTLTVVGHLKAAPAETVKSGVPAVVVVEDEIGIVELYQRILSRLPIRVYYARSASAGEALIAAEAPALVLLDVHLPDRSGLDLLRALKADHRTASIDVIVCSVDDGANAEALAIGAAECVMKPFDRERIAAAIMRRVTQSDETPAPLPRLKRAQA